MLRRVTFSSQCCLQVPHCAWKWKQNCNNFFLMRYKIYINIHTYIYVICKNIRIFELGFRKKTKQKKLVVQNYWDF